MPRKNRPWYRRSAGAWHVTYKKKQHNLHVEDETDEAAAWDAFRALVSKLNGTGQPVATVRSEPCAALVAEYLEAIAHKVVPRTKKGYESYLRRFVARFGNVQPALVDAATVEKDPAGENWSDSNRANYLWGVQAFVRWCGVTTFRLNRPAKESRGAEAVISEDTHRLVLREATGDFHELCRFWHAVGCRPMEGARLTAEGVDWASGTATLKVALNHDQMPAARRSPRPPCTLPRTAATLPARRPVPATSMWTTPS
jgi:hypothetical protein